MYNKIYKIISNWLTVNCLIISAIIFFTISLVTYDPFDPSLNRVSDKIISNYAGYAGAFVADLFYQTLGVSSIIIIPIFANWVFLVYKRKSYFFLLFCLPFALLATFNLSMIMHFLLPPENWYYADLGGAVGSLAANKILKYMEEWLYILINSMSFLVLLLASLGYKISEYKVLLAKFTKKKNENQTETEIYHEIEEDVNEPIFFQEEIAVVPRKPNKVIKKSNITDIIKPLKIGKSSYELPSVNLLKNYGEKPKKKSQLDNELIENKEKLVKVLKDFGVKGEIVAVSPGPVVTLYELKPAAGTKSSRVIGLADDIARSMSSVAARIAVIPGKDAIGIELPNATREIVFLRELCENKVYSDFQGSLAVILGKDISGNPIIADLAKMPHLLVAGTTGSGKSVAINTMILSFLYKMTPDECKFIMIDPKMLELSVYEGIPHLLAPVVTEPSKAIVALKWVVKEMENRYRLMSNMAVRNISNYNEKIKEAKNSNRPISKEVQVGFDPETGDPLFEKLEIAAEILPNIVVIVDEMADLMLVAGKDIEASIQRLAQMARAAGIHIIMATQRPSVDVITGVIKANFPTRISFQVTSRIDSRTILGEQGAEQLLGMGDMLYMSGGSRITRVHGPFVSDDEVQKVVAHLKKQGQPNYIEDITKDDELADDNSEDSGGESNDLYGEAVKIILSDQRVSTSYIQRRLKIGYNRAANLIEEMERKGVVSAPNHVGKREILIK